MKTIVLCVVGFLLAAVPARAGVTIEMSTDGGSQTISADVQNIRVQGQDVTMIFRGDQNVLWIVQQDQKTYRELTGADMKAMGEQIKHAAAQVQEEMKNVPPEQRAALEAVIAKHPGMHEPERPVVTATGESKTVNGWPCKEYTATTGQSVMDVWATDPKNLNIEASDLAAFKGLSAFMTQMLPGMETMRGLAKDFEKPTEGEVPGVPVLAVTHDEKGHETVRAELKSVTKSSLPASTFELPEGLTKEEMPKSDAAPPGK